MQFRSLLPGRDMDRTQLKCSRSCLRLSFDADYRDDSEYEPHLNRHVLSSKLCLSLLSRSFMLAFFALKTLLTRCLPAAPALQHVGSTSRTTVAKLENTPRVAGNGALVGAHSPPPAPAPRVGQDHTPKREPASAGPAQPEALPARC